MSTRSGCPHGWGGAPGTGDVARPALLGQFQAHQALGRLPGSPHQSDGAAGAGDVDVPDGGHQSGEGLGLDVHGFIRTGLDERPNDAAHAGKDYGGEVPQMEAWSTPARTPSPPTDGEGVVREFGVPPAQASLTSARDGSHYEIEARKNENKEILLAIALADDSLTRSTR